MSVAVNQTRKAVEISWDALGESGPPEVEPPEGFPEHPIYLPPYVDNTLPQPEQPVDPDYGVEEGGQPTHPIYLPPYIDNALPPHIDNTLPGDQPVIDNSLPEIEEIGLSDEQVEKIKSFLEGNLPSTGEPPHPTPVGGKQIAVQVFAQGQDGDWSNTAVIPNDGLTVLTYPKDWTGESYVEVRALDGSLVDSGTITVS
jgi:hypothetical protein